MLAAERNFETTAHHLFLDKNTRQVLVNALPLSNDGRRHPPIDSRKPHAEQR
jgi:hypothetical protein